MNLRETVSALRVMRIVIRDAAGAHLAPGHVFSATDLKVIKPDGTAVNGGTWITALPGDVLGGRFEVATPNGLPDQVGVWSYQIHGAGLSDDEWFDVVTDPIGPLFDAVIEGPSQYDGSGEAAPVGHTADEYDITLAGALRVILSYAAHTAANLDGIQGSPRFMSRVGGRIRTQANLVNGNRTVTSSDPT